MHFRNRVVNVIDRAISVIDRAITVIDRAIQLHGAAGVSQDFFLAHAYAAARSIRLADGPDQVHMMQLGRNLAAATTKL